MTQRLILFYTPSDPVCIKVLEFMKSKSIFVPLRDIEQNPDYRLQLEQAGGKAQVPCLFIDGGPLYDPDTIIRWLGENYF